MNILTRKNILLIFFLISFFLVFVFGYSLFSFMNSPDIKLFNAFLFIFSALSLTLLIARWFFENKLKWDWVFTGLLGFNFYFIFYHLKDFVFGRFLLYGLFLTDDTYSSILEWADTLSYRSYSRVIYDFIHFVTGFSPELEQLIFINRVFGFLIMALIYKLANTVLQNRFVAVLTVITFVSVPYAHQILSSIEYGTPALFFTLLSILFIYKYLITEKSLELLISIFAFFIAGFLRFELTVLFGFTYLVMLNFFQKKSEHGIILWIAITIGLFRALSFSSVVSTQTDMNLHGKMLEPGIFSRILNSIDLFYNNIFVHFDLWPPSGAITFFSITMVIAGVWFVVRRQKKFIFLFADAIFYMMIVLFFHVEGMRSGQKYSIFYYTSEIILTYASVLSLINKRFVREAVCCSVFGLSLLISPLHNFSVHRNATDVEIREYKALKSLNLNKSCLILKYDDDQPLITFYFPHQFQSFFISEQDPEDIRNKCLYHLDQKYLAEAYPYEKMDPTILKPLLEKLKCRSSVLYEERDFILSKLDC